MRRQDEPHRTYRTVPEVAMELGMSDRYVRDLIKRGELPGFRFGREFRVHEEELNAWINGQRISRGGN
jgi:excisionase family DNA binding protein